MILTDRHVLVYLYEFNMYFCDERKYVCSNMGAVS
jgi:hypothetical protein